MENFISKNWIRALMAVITVKAVRTVNAIRVVRVVRAIRAVITLSSVRAEKAWKATRVDKAVRTTKAIVSLNRYLPWLCLLLSGKTFAGSTGNLPFVSTMNMLKEAVSGPFLLASAILMIVVTCLMLAFGEWGEGFKKMINVVLWLSVAFAATSFVSTMFGGGAVF